MQRHTNGPIMLNSRSADKTAYNNPNIIYPARYIFSTIVIICRSFNRISQRARQKFLLPLHTVINNPYLQNSTPRRSVKADKGIRA